MSEFIFTDNLGIIEFSSNPSVLDFNGPCLTFGNISFDAGDGAFSLVAQTTSFGLRGYLDENFQWRVDGGSWTSVASGGITSQTTVVSGLSNSKHLFQVKPIGGNAYLNSVYCDNTPVSVAKAQNTFFQTSSAVFTASNLYVEGDAANNGASDKGAAYTAPFSGMVVEFQFFGTGFEEFGYDPRAWAISVDGEFDSLVSQADTGTFRNYWPMTHSASGTHTSRLIIVGGGQNAFRNSIRVINGSAITVASSIGDSTVAVDQTSFVSANDWVRIDMLPNREWMQVLSVTTTSITFTSPLSIGHGVGVSVCSYSATAGTISAWQSRTTPTKTLASIGDSNTEGANPYGFNGVPDSNGVYYTQYDPRRSFGFLATRSIGWNYINLGIQGTTTPQMIGRAATLVAYCPAGVDAITIFAGTNDVNGTSETQSNYSGYLQQIIDENAPYLKAGAKIILMPIGTPQGVTNAGGLDIAACNAVMLSLSENGADYAGAGPYSGRPYSTFLVFGSSILNGVNLTVYDASTNPTGQIDGTVHYRPSGQDRMAANLVALLRPATSRIRGGMRLGIGVGLLYPSVVGVGSGPTPPTPPVAGAIWWCYADTLSPGDASPWNDIGTGGNNLTTAGSKPQCVASQINGLNSVQFVAASSEFLTTTFSQGSQAQQNTIFLVCKWSAGTYVFDGKDSSDREALLNVGSWALFAGNNPAFSGFDITQYSIVAIQFNGASTKVWKNGVLVATVDAGAQALTGFNLGASYVPSGYSDMWVAAHGGYHAFSDADRISVQATLGNKYAITLGQPQITVVDLLGLNSANFITLGAGKSFILPTNVGICGIWFNTGTETQPDLSAHSVTNYVEITFGTMDSDSNIADAVNSALPSAGIGVSCSRNSTAQVIITDNQNATLASATDVNSGVAITIQQTGSGNS